MWSFGVMLIEIVSGFPISLGKQCKVNLINGKEKVGWGFFGFKQDHGDMLTMGKTFKRIFEI